MNDILKCSAGWILLYGFGFIVWGIGVLTLIYITFINTNIIGFKWNLKFTKIKILKVVEDGKTHYEIWRRSLFIFLIGHGGDYALAWRYNTYEEAKKAAEEILKNIPSRSEEEMISI